MSSRTPSQQTTTGLYQPSALGSYAYDAVATHSVEGNVRSIEMATDRTAWTAESDGCIRVRQLPSGSILKTIESKGKATFCNALLLVEGKIWAAYSDGFIRRYDSKTASLEREVVQHDGAVYTLLYAAGRVYSGGADWKVYQWNPSSCEYQRLFFGHSNSVRCLASLNTSHGLLLFSGSDDGTIRAWDPHAPLQSTKDVACIHIFKQHTRSVLALEAVPSRKQLWSGSEDHTIRVWSTDSFQCNAVLDRHRAPVASLAFVSTRVWSGGKDGTLFLWDAKTLSAIQTIQEGIHVSPRYVMCIKRLYRAHYYKLWTSTSDGFIQCWNADTDGTDEDGFELVTVDEEIARRRDAARIEGLQAALYEHGAMLNEKEDEIKSLQHRIEQLKDPHQNPDILGLSQRVDILNTDLDESAQQREQLTQRCTMADELLRATRQRLKDSESQRRETESDRDRLQTLVDASARELADLKTMRQEFLVIEQERSALQQHSAKLREEATEMQQTIEHLEDAVRSHQHIFAENGRLRHEVEVLEASLLAERRHAEQQLSALSSTPARGVSRSSPSPGSATRRGNAKGQGTSPHSPGAPKSKKSMTTTTALQPRALSSSSRRHELDTTDEDEEENEDNRSEYIEPSLIPTTDDEAPLPRAHIPAASPCGDVGSASTNRLQERLENLRIENESLMQQLGAQQSAYEQELVAMQTRLSQVEQQHHHNAQVSAAHEKLKHETSKTIGELRASLKMSQAEAHSKAQQLAQLQEETEGSADSHRKDLNKKEKQLIELRDALAKAQHALDSVRRESEERTAAHHQEKELIKRQLADARREKDRAMAEAAQRHSMVNPSDDGTASGVNSPDTLRKRLHDTQRELESTQKELRLQKLSDARAASEILVLRDELAQARLEPSTPPRRGAASPNASPPNRGSSAQRHKASRRGDDESSTPGSPTSSSHNSTLGELSIALVQLRNECDELKQQKKDAENAMQQVVHEAEEARRTCEAAVQRSQELDSRQQAQHEALQEALDFLQAEKERFDALHETYTSMSSALQLAQDRETEYEERADMLIGEIDALKKDMKNLELQLQLAKSERDMSRHASDERRARVPSPVSPQSAPTQPSDGFYTPEGSEPLQQLIEELEEALEGKQRALDQAAEDLDVLEQRMSTVTEDLVKCISQRRVADELNIVLQSSLDAQRDESERLQRDLTSASEHVARLQREVAAMQVSSDGTVAHLQGQLADALEKVEAERRSVTQSNQRLAAAETAMTETSLTLATLKDDFRDLLSKFDEQAKSLGNAEGELSHLRASCASLQSERDVLSTKLSDAHESATRDLREASATCVNLRRLLETEQGHHSAAKGVAESREKSIQRLQGEIDGLRGAMRVADEKHHEAARAYEHRLQEFEARAMQAEETVEETQRSLQQLSRTHHTEMEDAVAHAQQEHDRRVRELQQTWRLEIHELRNSSDKKDEMRKKAERQLSSKELELTDTAARATSAESKCGTLERELQDALQQLQEARSGSHETIRDLQKNAERLADHLHRVEITLELRSKENDGLTSELKRANERNEQTSAKFEDQLRRVAERGADRDKELAHLKTSTQEQLQAIRSLQQEVDVTMRQLEREREAHAATASLLASAHSTVASQAESVSVLSQENERLQTQRDEWHREASTIGSERLALSATLDALKEDHMQLMDAHNDLSNSLAQQGRHCADLNDELTQLKGRLDIAEVAAAELVVLKSTHQETTSALHSVEAELAALRRQEQHWKTYANELEGSLDVVKRSLKERSEQLVALEEDGDRLRDRIVSLELTEAKQRHQLHENEREHGELLRLREVCADNAGVADAAYQEHKILADQLALVEERNEHLEAQLRMVEEKLLDLTGAPEQMLSLTKDRDALQAEVARLDAALAQKTEEALEGLRAEDRANQLSARIETLLSDLQRVREESTAQTQELESVISDQEKRLLSNAHVTDQRTRELNAASERLREADADAAAAADMRREFAQCRRDLTRAEQTVQNLQEENAVLKRSLASTGPLSQLEVDSSIRALEQLNKSQQEQLQQQESSMERLHEAVKADQVLMALAVGEARSPVGVEQLLRELAESKAHVHTLQSSVASLHQSLDLKERTTSELRQRLRMLESMFFRPGVGAGSAIKPQNVHERGEDASTRGVVDATRGGDDDHLVPTPSQTPRGGSMADGTLQGATEAHVGGALVVSSARVVPTTSPANPALLRAYTEHLSAALERSTELCAQLQKCAFQRSEGQKLLAERLSAVRGAILASSGGSTIAALVDEANNHRVCLMEASLQAHKSRIEALQNKVREHNLNASLTVLREREGAAAVESLQHLLHEQGEVMEALKEERDRARLDAQQRSMTIASLVHHLQHHQTRREGSEGTQSLWAAESALALEQNATRELRVRVSELHATIAQLQAVAATAGCDGDVADAVHKLVSGHELTEDKLYLSEQLAQRQAVELAQAYSDLSAAHDTVRAKEAELASSEEATRVALCKLDAANSDMEELHKVIEQGELKLAQQEMALAVRQQRREELVQWIRSTPQLRETMSTLSEQEAYDTLTVCRHLHRLLMQSQLDAQDRSAKDAQRREHSLTEAKEHECAVLRDRAEQLAHDVRSALDDAEVWRERFQSCTEGRVEAVQRAAKSEASMLALEAALEVEQRKGQHAQQALSELLSAKKSRDELVDSLQARIQAQDERIRDLQVDLEVKSVEMSTKQAVVSALQEDLDVFHSMQKKLEAKVYDLETRAVAAEEARTMVEEERDAAVSSAQQYAATLRAVEERYNAEVSSSESTRERLETNISALRKENARISELTQAVHEALAKSEHHEREEKSLTKRLAIAQELNHHLKEQNGALERSRADAAQLRMRLGGTSAADVAALRRLCVEVFRCVPEDTCDRTVVGYATLLESHALRLKDDHALFADVFRVLGDLSSDLAAARQATSSMPMDPDHGSLSLTPTPSEGGCSERSSRTTSPAPCTTPPPPPQHSAAAVLSALERVASEGRHVSLHHRHLAENLNMLRGKMMHLADHNKRLSEEVEILSHKLKQATSRLLRSENSEQLLTFVEPSRDVAVRALFHLREHVNDMKIHLTMLQGTTNQTREHWAELHLQLTAHLDPLKGLLQQCQRHLSHAFEQCLTAQEKDEVLGGSGGGDGLHVDGPTSEPSSRTQTPRHQGESRRSTPTGEEDFDGQRTIKPSVTTPHHRSMTSSAIIGRGGESAIANKDIVARGIQEARRRGQAWAERDT